MYIYRINDEFKLHSPTTITPSFYWRDNWGSLPKTQHQLFTLWFWSNNVVVFNNVTY